jgi:hypothetical protein
MKIYSWKKLKASRLHERETQKGKLGLEIGLKQFPKPWNEHSTIFGPNMN